MFKYCNEKIIKLKYIFVSAEEIKQTEEAKRFELCLRVTGTRQYHRFIPISDNQIRCYTTSTHKKNLMSTKLQLCLLTHLRLQTWTMSHAFMKISGGWA